MKFSQTKFKFLLLLLFAFLLVVSKLNDKNFISRISVKFSVEFILKVNAESFNNNVF